ncbi:hypothetical protein NOGI109294_20325 [Nocardiopsis gilva]
MWRLVSREAIYCPSIVIIRNTRAGFSQASAGRPQGRGNPRGPGGRTVGAPEDGGRCRRGWTGPHTLICDHRVV